MLCSAGVCLVVVASSGSWFAAQYFVVWSSRFVFVGSWAVVE